MLGVTITTKQTHPLTESENDFILSFRTRYPFTTPLHHAYILWLDQYKYMFFSITCSFTFLLFYLYFILEQIDQWIDNQWTGLSPGLRQRAIVVYCSDADKAASVRRYMNTGARRASFWWERIILRGARSANLIQNTSQIRWSMGSTWQTSSLSLSLFFFFAFSKIRCVTSVAEQSPGVQQSARQDECSE